MNPLIDRDGIRADTWLRVDGDAVPAADADCLLALAQWRDAPGRWDAHEGRIGIELAPDDDPAGIADALDRLSLIAVRFPKFTDGRGYSIARLLREAYGWRGELRAVGDVLPDQLFLMARCGFDTFALRDDQDPHAALAAFSSFSVVYQPGADALETVMQQRLTTLATR